MAVHPETQAFLDDIAAAGGKPWNQMTPAEARETWYLVCGLFAGAPEPITSLEDQVIPGPGGEIDLRSYTPAGSGPFAAVVYLHGGWVVGTTDTYQASSRALANATGAKVFFPTYRMAPEFKYPAAVEDCYAAVKWIAENAATLNVDPNKIVVAGDSAGGNLSAAVALMARDRGRPAIAYQVLLYPVTDHSFDTGSYKEFGTGFLLEGADMPWFWNHYLPDARAGKEAYASPLRADNLSGLPPALVITAECDVLRDEGEAYAAKMQAAGVPVTLSRYDGAIHGFMHPLEGKLPFAKDGLAEIAAILKKALA
jgi:acetyl esterase